MISILTKQISMASSRMPSSGLCSEAESRSDPVWWCFLQSYFLKSFIFRDWDGTAQPSKSKAKMGWRKKQGLLDPFFFQMEKRGFRPRPGVIVITWLRYHMQCFQSAWDFFQSSGVVRHTDVEMTVKKEEVCILTDPEKWEAHHTRSGHAGRHQHQPRSRRRKGGKVDKSRYCGFCVRNGWGRHTRLDWLVWIISVGPRAESCPKLSGSWPVGD